MEKVSFRQFILFVFAVCLGTVLFNAPAFFAEKNGRDAWAVFTLAQVIQLLAVAATLLLQLKFPDDRLDDVLARLFGKVAAKLILSFLTLFFLFKFLTDLNIGYNFYSNNFIETGSYLLYIAPVLLFIFYAGTKKLRIAGRFLEIMFVFALIALLTYIILGAFSADYDNLRPIAAGGAAPILGGLKHHLVFSGDTLVLLIFAGKTVKARHPWKKTFAAAGACILISAAFYIVFTASYGDAARYLSVQIIHLGELPFKYSNTGNTGVALLLVYSVFSTAKSFLFCYAACECLRLLTGIKKMWWYFLGAVILALFLPAFIPGYSSLGEGAEFIKYLFLIPSVILPALIIAATLISISRKGKHETKATAER